MAAKIKKEKEEKDSIDPPDMLPKEKCLQALAELRHSKWFQSMAVRFDDAKKKPIALIVFYCKIITGSILFRFYW